MLLNHHLGLQSAGDGRAEAQQRKHMCAEGRPIFTFGLIVPPAQVNDCFVLVLGTAAEQA